MLGPSQICFWLSFRPLLASTHSLCNSKQCKKNVPFCPPMLSHLSCLPMEILRCMLLKPKDIFWQRKQKYKSAPWWRSHSLEMPRLTTWKLNHLIRGSSTEVSPVSLSPAESWFILCGVSHCSKTLCTELPKCLLQDHHEHSLQRDGGLEFRTIVLWGISCIAPVGCVNFTQ